MKIKKVQFLYSFAFFFIFFMTTSSVLGAFQENDTYTLTEREQVIYTDGDGIQSSYDQSTTVAIVITGANSTWINYTSTITSSPYFSDWALIEGSWNSVRIDGSIDAKRVNDANLTAYKDNLDSLFYLDIWDAPTWINDTAGLNYRFWNETGGLYESRYAFFDREDEVAIDSIELIHALPLAVDNIEEFISIFKDVISDAINETLLTVETVSFNIDSETSFGEWWLWRDTNLIDGVAYSFILTDAIEGIIEFTPAWRGEFWSPNESQRWNGVDWVDNVNPIDDNWSFDFLPPAFLNGMTGFWELTDEWQYTSTTILNGLDSADTIFMNDFEISFSERGMSMEFSVPYEEILFNYFADPNDRALGNLTILFEFEYDSKGFLVKLKEQNFYEVPGLGNLLTIMELSLGTGASTPGFDVIIFSASLSAVAGTITLRKRKKL